MHLKFKDYSLNPTKFTREHFYNPINIYVIKKMEQFLSRITRKHHGFSRIKKRQKPRKTRNSRKAGWFNACLYVKSGANSRFSLHLNLSNEKKHFMLFLCAIHELQETNLSFIFACSAYLR